MRDIEKIKKIYETLNKIVYFKDIDKKGEFVQKIYNIYGDKIDIIEELRRMEIWLDVNPQRRKKNYKRFIFFWLNRALERKKIQEEILKIKEVELAKEKKFLNERSKEYEPTKKVIE